MKKYKLLKDLPFAKAGEEFSLHRGGIRDCITLFKDDEEIYQFKVGENVSEMFDEWFEEIKEEQSFIINTLKAQVEKTMKVYHPKRAIENLKSLGLLFKTKEEAEEHLGRLKARAILLEDVKPHDSCNHEWGVRFNRHDGELYVYNSDDSYVSEIIFLDENDAYNSIKKHEEEWRTYFGVE